MSPRNLWGVVLMTLALWARTASPAPTPAPAPAARDGVSSIADPDGLIAVYRELGLPMPPDGAPLVRYVSGTRFSGDDPKGQPIENLAFLIREAKGKEPAVLLIGPQAIPFDREFEVVDHRTVSVENFEAEGCWPFQLNAGLAMAIQCRARGWQKLADALMEPSMKASPGHPRSPFRQREGLSPRAVLSHLAWIHSLNECMRLGVDRAPLARRMKALSDAEAALNTQAHREVLRSLEAALVPSKAAPGSPEALVDALVDFAGNEGGEPDPAYDKLAMLGFEAVPALIDHLADPRLTRSIQAGFNNFPSWPRPVGHVAGDLLKELAGDDVGNDWLDRQKGFFVNRDAAQKWWEKARAQGEEAYFVANVLAGGRAPHTLILKIIERKYPARLPEIFTTILEKRRDVQIHPVADALGRSALPREKKLELILLAADDKDLEVRRAAFWRLKDLDERAFVERLVRTLDSLPATPEEPYWHCREASFANLTMQTADQTAWAALTRAAKRADVWLRMQYLNPMSNAYNGDRHRRQRLEFCAAFLDDAEVRVAKQERGMPDTKSKFFGPYAGFTYPRLEVRELAAMQIGSMLKLPDRSAQDWTPQQWSAFRETVKDALERELEKGGRE